MTYTYDENTVSDLHKDAHGFRPSTWFWEEWSRADAEGKQRIWDNLLWELDQTMAEERRREEIAVGDFERGVRVNMAYGATCRAEAIRWMLDGVLKDHDLMYGGEYACYLFNLPWNPYRAELDPIVEQIFADRGQKEVDNLAA
jgi:hypothetical protein